MNLTSALRYIFFSGLQLSSGSLSSLALRGKHKDEKNGPYFAGLNRRLENELVVEEDVQRHREKDDVASVKVVMDMYAPPESNSIYDEASVIDGNNKKNNKKKKKKKDKKKGKKENNKDKKKDKK